MHHAWKISVEFEGGNELDIFSYQAWEGGVWRVFWMQPG
jgi:hypothetical protein